MRLLANLMIQIALWVLAALFLGWVGIIAIMLLAGAGMTVIGWFFKAMDRMLQIWHLPDRDKKPAEKPDSVAPKT